MAETHLPSKAPPEVAQKSQRFIIFRGNATLHLRAAFARRHPRWKSAGPPEPTAATGREGVVPSKIDENLKLSKALAGGDVAFVFRDLLVGPHWVAQEMPSGQKPPTVSLHSAHYPATTANGATQIVNRWPRHASLTSKDGSLKALVDYYKCQDLSPWYYVPLSFSVPNMKLLKAEPTSSPAWRTVKQAFELTAGRADPRVDDDQAHHNMWLLKVRARLPHASLAACFARRKLRSPHASTARRLPLASRRSRLAPRLVRFASCILLCLPLALAPAAAHACPLHTAYQRLGW